MSWLLAIGPAFEQSPHLLASKTVRRQSFWDSELVHLREALARLLGDVKRPADDAARVDW